MNVVEKSLKRCTEASERPVSSGQVARGIASHQLPDLRPPPQLRQLF
jgi:hypothetical protein